MPKAGSYPAYTLVTLKSRDKYVSKNKHKSHAEASVWVKACQGAHGFKGTDMLGRPETWTDQPSGATVYP